MWAGLKALVLGGLVTFHFGSINYDVLNIAYSLHSGNGNSQFQDFFVTLKAFNVFLARTT